MTTEQVQYPIVMQGAEKAAASFKEIAKAQRESQKAADDAAKSYNVLSNELKGAARLAEVETRAQERLASALKMTALANTAGAKAANQGFSSITQSAKGAAITLGNFANAAQGVLPELTGMGAGIVRASSVIGAMTSALGGPLGLAAGGLVAALGVYSAYTKTAKDDTEELTKAMVDNAATARAIAAEKDQAYRQRRGFRTQTGQSGAGLASDQVSPVAYGSHVDYGADEDGVPFNSKAESDEYFQKKYQQATKDARQLAINKAKEAQAKAKSAAAAEAAAYKKGFPLEGDVDARIRRLREQEILQLARMRSLGVEPVENVALAGTSLQPGDKGYDREYFAAQAENDRRRALQKIAAAEAGDRASVARNPMNDPRYGGRFSKSDADFLAKQDKSGAEIAANRAGFDATLEQQTAREAREWDRRDKRVKDHHDLLRNSAHEAWSMVGASAGAAFAAIAAGQKVSAQELLKGLGSQLVAAGTGHIFEGIFQSLMLNPLGPEMVGIGTAEAAFGATLAGVGGAVGGGSRGAGGGRGTFQRTAAPASPSSYTSPTANDTGSTQHAPVHVTVNSYGNPDPDFGQFVHRSVQKAQQQGRI